MREKKDIGRFKGCLLGGAIGDALGETVDSLKYNEIKEKYGEEGIVDLVCEENGKAIITDDTQLTLFTAEGLLRAETRKRVRGACYPPTVVYYAYLRWLHTQGYPKKENIEGVYDGYLIKIKELYVNRSPDNTCLSALASGKQGTIENHINDSKGCGGVKRVAPAGLYVSKENAFELGSECAALTHGHPSGYLSAGVLAYIIAGIIEGLEIEEAVAEALDKLPDYNGYEECNSSIRKAIKLVKSDQEPRKAISFIGEGRVAEEALAIAVYSALKYPHDFKKALYTAVNHDGGSNNAGAITGNILGTYLGIEGIPVEWIEKVELTDILLQVADDLFTGYKGTLDWWRRYPGY
ncbi:MAG: ADP-ribosylglycohydrolase family protein [Clostridia bacterium]|nr:ADP-ribosylglycohydrolase family protein [Clostridia bacterium]MDD4146498.1 ADP-ribosylglycohydrolase family protein [Clostridia bacterium]MDD4666011.1 ADP-ribosylglycohydrolase family protein [Clostridia bacterium]